MAEPERITVTVSGRTELGGNHTDHQGGCVLASSVDLSMTAWAEKRGDRIVSIRSAGHPPFDLDVTEPGDPDPALFGTSKALVMGVAKGIRDLGYQIGGFHADIRSDIPSGSGVSSSAAFEVLIGRIFNAFYCGGKLTDIQIAKIGQYAESVYFGKPCGLMDQIACAVGGIVFIDFRDPAEPKVEKVNFDFKKTGYDLRIQNVGSSHADLTADYASIPRDMCAVARQFGKNVLSEVDESEFFNRKEELVRTLGELPVSRAEHFFAETKRPARMKEALERNDFETYLSIVRESAASSETLLKNIVPTNGDRTLEHAILAEREKLGGKGAVRVHGGGFAGTIQIYAPKAVLLPYEDEYPRPQLRRDSYLCLNGEWKLNGRPIRVPFPPESALSGFGADCGERLRYEKTFLFEKTKQRAVLHFGAVDQTCAVFLNGVSLGTHKGGYLPFSFDVTDCIRNGENKLVVTAEDTISPDYPYGKQTKHPGGMWYTPVSGIWQTVWIEELPDAYITGVRIDPDLHGADLTIFVSDRKEPLHERVEIEEPELWEPGNPRLYTHTVTYGDDAAEIYFALRTVEIRTEDGVPGVFLNGKRIFLHGVLDQGYFEDGIFLPEDPEEYMRDVRRMQDLGFNLLRKHIKVEPESFYYACDRAGMLVLQDMPNSGTYSFFRDTALGTAGIPLPDRTGTYGFRKQFFISHMRETADHLHNHPCVIGFTIFNEGWGQFESDQLYTILKEQEPARIIDSTSGWFRQKKSDFDSEHVYFRTKKLRPGKRPFLLSECGGFTLSVSGHVQQKKKYGYGECTSSKELTERIVSMYEEMVLPGIPEGVCGCIYTQLSDVEGEINGLYTYDRRICKVLLEPMLRLADRIMNSLPSGESS